MTVDRTKDGGRCEVVMMLGGHDGVDGDRGDGDDGEQMVTATGK